MTTLRDFFLIVFVSSCITSCKNPFSGHSGIKTGGLRSYHDKDLIDTIYYKEAGQVIKANCTDFSLKHAKQLPAAKDTSLINIRRYEVSPQCAKNRYAMPIEEVRAKIIAIISNSGEREDSLRKSSLRWPRSQLAKMNQANEVLSTQLEAISKALSSNNYQSVQMTRKKDPETEKEPTSPITKDELEGAKRALERNIEFNQMLITKYKATIDELVKEPSFKIDPALIDKLFATLELGGFAIPSSQDENWVQNQSSTVLQHDFGLFLIALGDIMRDDMFERSKIAVAGEVVVPESDLNRFLSIKDARNQASLVIAQEAKLQFRLVTQDVNDWQYDIEEVLYARNPADQGGSQSIGKMPCQLLYGATWRPARYGDFKAGRNSLFASEVARRLGDSWIWLPRASDFAMINNLTARGAEVFYSYALAVQLKPGTISALNWQDRYVDEKLPRFCVAEMK